MKILVTGLCGFIGSHFAEIAYKAGHDVVGIDCLAYSGRMKNIQHLIPSISFHNADICDADTLSFVLHAHRPDAVVHFAAESHVQRSIVSHEEFLRTNIVGTNVLLDECIKYWRDHKNFRFIHVSTDEVYGSLGLDDQSWTESSPYLPNNVYAATKAASDHLVRAYHHTYGFPAIITHAANNYGSRQHPEKLIPTICHQMIHDKPVTIHGDGMNIRDWLNVDDHCWGIMLAVVSGQIGEVYNFGGECERTNLEIANLIFKTQGLKPKIQYVADRLGNDKRYSTSNSKVNATLGWVAGFPIETRINETVEWYISNPYYGEDYGK